MHRICGPWNYLALYSGSLFCGLLMQGISPALPYPSMYYSVLRTYVYMYLNGGWPIRK